ncbi:MAG TPA: MFS transporter [Candidatus Binatia bacterium]|nr:MFS transporter [Candidatus Binatia bacterium]
MVDAPGKPRSWAASIESASWTGLIASWFGWFFDGYETYTLVLIAAIAVRALENVPPAQLPPYIAGLFAITLVGWATGGLIAGVLADYIGRKRVMMYSIVVYAVFALLSALSANYWWLLAARFCTGLGIGGEWGSGASLVNELWPAAIRGRVAGIFQSAFGVGFLLATVVWLFVGPSGPNNWRIMLVLGFLPALFVLYIRTKVRDPQLWQTADALRRAAAERAHRGESLGEQERELVKFSVSRVFATPELARRTTVLLLLSLTTLIGWWGISTWIPQYAAGVARAHGLANPLQFATTTALMYNVGAILGYVGFGFIADAIGRKLTMWLYFLGSLIINPVLFLWTRDPTMVVVVAAINGFFTLGQFSWMAVYVPELFPTAVRATAVSVVFNLARYVVAITTFYAGILAVQLGGIAQAATVIGFIYVLGLVVTPAAGPETKGEPLPA